MEWKIYFLFPLLVWTLRRAGIPALLAVAAVLAAAYTRLLHAAFPGMTLELTCPWYIFLFGMGVSAGWAAARPDVSRRFVPWIAVRGAAGGGVPAQPVPPPQRRSAPLHRAPALDGRGRRGAGVVPADPARRRRARHLGRPGAGRAVGPPAGLLRDVRLLHLPVPLPPAGHDAPASRAAPGPSVPAHAVLGLRLRQPALVLAASYLFFLLFERPFLNTHKRETLAETARDGLSPSQFWTYTLLSLPCVLAASYLFFLLFERPFLNTHKRETPAETARDAALAPAP